MTYDLMQKAPDITEIKCLLRDVLSHGDQGAIANILGVKPADVSQRFNPDSDRKPGLVEGLREVWAITAVNQEAGWKLKAYLNGLLDNWLNPIKATDKNLSALIGDAQEALTALISARLDGKSLSEQREEGRAARAALDQLLAGLDLEFELRSDSNVNPFPRQASR